VGQHQFCGDRCYSEWKTRDKIVKKELPGQPSVVVGSGISVGEITDPVPVVPAPSEETHVPELPARRITVSEFLAARSPEEIEDLAAQISAPQKTKRVNPFSITLLILSFMLAVFAGLSQWGKVRARRAEVQTKKETEAFRAKQAARIKRLHSKTVPLSTSGINITFPPEGHQQLRGTVNIYGTCPKGMALTLVGDGRVRAHKKIYGDHFFFRTVGLQPGENRFVIKGVGLAQTLFRTGVTVWRGPKRGASPVQKTPAIHSQRNINYQKTQIFVSNAFDRSLNFSRGSEAEKWVALTFDGGAHTRGAAEILDTLKERGVQATFFLTGRFIQKHGDLVRRIHAEHHVLGNHTESHPHLTNFEADRTHSTLEGVDRGFLIRQLEQVTNRYQALGIPMSPIWRAPYGEQNRTINQWAASLGLMHIGWTQGSNWRMTLDTNDWVVRPSDPGYFSPDEVIKKIVNFGKGTEQGLNGGIILMHVGTLRKREPMYSRLGVLIDTLKSSGYQLVTIPEMLKKNRPKG